jgi:hypothetical protein
VNGPGLLLQRELKLALNFSTASNSQKFQEQRGERRLVKKALRVKLKM